MFTAFTRPLCGSSYQTGCLELAEGAGPNTKRETLPGGQRDFHGGSPYGATGRKLFMLPWLMTPLVSRACSESGCAREVALLFMPANSLLIVTNSSAYSAAAFYQNSAYAAAISFGDLHCASCCRNSMSCSRRCQTKLCHSLASVPRPPTA
jgi:hypothetical protein